MDKTILNKIYKGVLAKVIGVRYGSPVEMWTSEEIKSKYEGVDGYLCEYNDYAADDDLNGPIFFFKALKDYDPFKTSSLDIAKVWMNYISNGHGFFWWGGYGISEEHTAYLNIKNGIMPPVSGSSCQNSKTLANQIGGQIFSDFWGLVSPLNPSRAKELAKAQSEVSHDEEAIYGGIYVAVLISLAFDNSKTVKEIILDGLNYIPNDSTYKKTVEDIVSVYDSGMSESDCFTYIKANYWKDKYGGNCHIIPNIAIMIYSMLYGEGDFIKSLKICNYSGFDTDCNCGNIATILGVYTSLDNVDYDKWIKPINDIVICSSAFGYLNILNIPSIALDIYNTYLKLEEKKYEIRDLDKLNLDFRFDNSTSGLRFSDNTSFKNINNSIIFSIKNKEEKIYYKTYYGKNDFTDNRYDPVTSPKAYSGETIEIDYEKRDDREVFIYYKDYHTKKIYLSEEGVKEFKILSKSSIISEVGLIVRGGPSTLKINSFKVTGFANYEIDFSKETIEDYSLYHNEISGCSYFDGMWNLEDSNLRGRGLNDSYLITSKFMKNFTLEYNLSFVDKPYGGISFLMAGVRRNYTLVFDSFNQEIKLIKYNDFDEITLFKTSFKVETYKNYKTKVLVRNDSINIYINDERMINIVDKNRIEKGAIGVYTNNGSVIQVKNIKIMEVE